MQNHDAGVGNRAKILLHDLAGHSAATVEAARACKVSAGQAIRLNRPYDELYLWIIVCDPLSLCHVSHNNRAWRKLAVAPNAFSAACALSLMMKVRGQ